MTKIKLCGLSRSEDILCANELLPDYIGFVFAKGSRRYVSFDKARALREMADKRIKAVGVFVDASEDEIVSLVRDGIIDIAQLHGNEDEEYIARLRELGVNKIIRAYPVASISDVRMAANSGADCILLDSGQGGGLSFDWELAKNLDRPYFLAGGLSGLNVKSAIETLHPYAVDVSSGIETEGLKDPEKMKDFVLKVRGGA